MRGIEKSCLCENCKKMKCAYSRCDKQEEIMRSGLPPYAIIALQKNCNTILSLKRVKNIGENKLCEMIKNYIDYTNIVLRTITDFVVIEIIR